MRAQTLALRAINQYRRRDTLAYVGLRYFLNNRCARRDRWANEIATHLVRTRRKGPYFGSQHFKVVDGEGEVLHCRRGLALINILSLPPQGERRR